MRCSLSTLWSIHSNTIEQNNISLHQSSQKQGKNNIPTTTNYSQNSKLVISQSISIQSRLFVAYLKPDNDLHTLTVLSSIPYVICSINFVKNKERWQLALLTESTNFQQKRLVFYRHCQIEAIRCWCCCYQKKHHGSGYRPHRKIEAWCQFPSKVAH